MINTNQALIETLARIVNLVPIRSLPPDQTSPPDIAPKVAFMKLPTKMYPSFFDRHDTLQKIDQVLGRDESTTSFRSIALFGLGGIGKSSIAARYIERQVEEKKYNAIFWVYAETKASLRQSFTDIATLLKLPGTQPHLHDDNLIQVQSWFQTTGKSSTINIIDFV